MFSWFKNLCSHTKPEIIMIAAIQKDRGIGYHGDLIHTIKDDMKHFVDQTTGHTVIMGRKNWESIPAKYRPLKHRQNIIVSRDTNYRADGALVVTSIEDAIKKSDQKKIYIIGGGQMYNLGMAYADTLDLTIIDDTKPADVFFPDFVSMFSNVEKSEWMYDEQSHVRYQFQMWERR
ncbi:dihydrofolate reductase [Patescibacteria group bacterium]|nr:dihydrofolate reductase [Patescibacteria group bacterium]